MSMCCWCLVGWVAIVIFGVPQVKAQTIEQHFSVQGGFAHFPGLGAYRQGVYLGGRAYLGPWVFVSGSGNWHRRADYYTVSVGGVLRRSARLRVLMHAGFMASDGYGYPVGGIGMEYGGEWGGLGQIDYILTRTSGEGFFVGSIGMYWGR